MLVLAILIYVVMTLCRHPLWPIEGLFWKGGPIGFLVTIIFFALLIAGLSS